ncbi:MAG: type IV toxin-antitoxin system AbiEi family antitoxin domain-containing protein [Chitinispirillia bacterium]|jgi:hypothetical protein
MGIQKYNKLNQLLRLLPKGTIATTTWLNTMGINAQLLQKYKSSNWIEKVCAGVVKYPDNEVDWTGVVYALQSQLHQNVHPAAKTALTIQGAGHFIPQGRKKVFLFAKTGEYLPSWLTKVDWDADFVIIKNNLFDPELQVGLKKETLDNFDISISSRERAIFEVLYLIPKYQSFEEASLLMQNLTTLRPKVVQVLLENCNSIRVKRSFMVLAEKENHDWLSELKISRIDLGKGKRSLFKGGYLHPKYQITIPEMWKKENDEVLF